MQKFNIVATLFLAMVVSLSTVSLTTGSFAQTESLQADQVSSSPLDIQSPAINKAFTWSGLSSSVTRQLPGEDPQGQTAIILPPREDDAIYTGMLDYATNRPVDVLVWNIISPSNSTAIPEDFGNLDDYRFSGNETVVFTTLDTGTSGSVPFNANAIELVSPEGEDGEPFIASYSLHAYPAPSEIVNNLSSLSAFAETDSDEG